MKWNLPDSARAVLPTTHNHDETFPLGLGVSFATSQSIKQGIIYLHTTVVRVHSRINFI